MRHATPLAQKTGGIAASSQYLKNVAWSVPGHFHVFVLPHDKWNLPMKKLLFPLLLLFLTLPGCQAPDTAPQETPAPADTVEVTADSTAEVKI